MVVGGSTTNEDLETYVEQVLSPTLWPERVVVMDNLDAYKGERMQKLIKERGCELLYLPPYSPDLNSIEEVFSKVKAAVAADRGSKRHGTPRGAGHSSSAVTSRDTRGFFEHCGYRLSANRYDRCALKP